MNVLTLILASLKSRKGNTALSILLIASGIMLATMVVLFNTHLQKRLSADGAGIDMVLGAKGSPLQLVLSAVYHTDIPTGNIDPANAAKWLQNPQIKTAIPLALGDNWRGHRIIGTTPDYMAHYHADITEGRLWHGSFEAVAGADVPLTPGQSFTGAHGLFHDHSHDHAHNHDDHHHDDHHDKDHDDGHNQTYTITGKLARTGTVLDRLILTSTQSVQALHDNSADLTAYLLTLKTPYAHLGLTQQINRESAMQAAHPATEMARLASMLGTGTRALTVFAALLVGIAALTMFAGIATSLDSRKGDIAVLRALGFTRARIMRLIAGEGFILAACGTALGVALGYAGFAVFANTVRTLSATGAAISAPPPALYALIALTLLSGIAASLIPALRAARLDASTQLAKDA